MDKKRSVGSEIREWVFTIVVTFVVVMILQAKVFAMTEVQQSSMNDTLYQDEHVFVDKLSYEFTEPRRGDIVIFLYNEANIGFFDDFKTFFTDVADKFKAEKVNMRLIKRVIGVPGDEINIKGGVVYINGVELKEHYAKGKTFPKEVKYPVKVPEGRLFVMGDNREQSKDSRTFGLIDSRQVEGRALYRVWPANKFMKLK